jgi:arabinofuranan 3-O-arabinosyltransferase
VPASLSATLPSLESLSDSDLAAAVRTEFTATPVYRAWLAVGLGAALALLAAGALLLRSSRRTVPAAATDHTPDHTPGITAGYAEDGAQEHLAHGQAGSVLRRRIRVGAAVPAWGAVAWILAGPAGTAVAAVALGVLVSALRYRRPTGHRKVPAPVKLLAGIRARHILLVTGAAATALFTRGPWGGGGLSGDYAGASLTVQLLFVACLTAVVLPLPSARRDDHHRDTARRAGSSTSE